MLLAIDIGNSHIVFTLFDHTGTCPPPWRLQTHPIKTADQYALDIAGLLAFRNLSLTDIDAVMIASVVPSLQYPLTQFCRHYLSLTPQWVTSAICDSLIPLKIDHPHLLGADRVVNLFEAHKQWPKNLIIIDSGTATTFDVMDGKGHYIGGAIAPGIESMASSLHTKTAQLPNIALDSPPQVVAKNAVHAMQSGIILGYMGLLDGWITRCEEEQGTAMTVVLTGGYCEMIHKYLKHPAIVDKMLTLRGLYTLSMSS